MEAATIVEEGLPGARQGPLPYKWMALICSASGTLFTTVTMGIVVISLPSIAEDFHASLTTIQWVLTIYPLVTVSSMLALGYFSDIVGRKRIFTAGALVYAAGSFLCGIAQSPLQLIAFRVLQSLGAAMVVANGSAIITDAFPPKERGMSLGVVSTVASFGLSLGPGIGGLVVDAAGWRWVFFVSVPFTLITATLSILYLRDRPRKERPARRFDIAGVALLAAATGSFLLALSKGQGDGWTQWSVGALGLLFLASVIALVKVERRVPFPTIDFALLSQRLFAAAAATGLLGFTALFAVMFLMPFYLTRTAGYSESQAGLVLTAIPVAMGLTSFVAGWLCDRIGSRWLCAAGLSLCAASLGLLAALGRAASFEEAGLPLLLFGAGIGIFMTPNNSAVMGCVPVSRLGMASALVGTLRHLGTALGVAVGGAVFATRLAAYTVPGVAVDGTIFDPAASVGAFRDAYLVLGALCLVGVVTALIRGKETAH